MKSPVTRTTRRRPLLAALFALACNGVTSGDDTSSDAATSTTTSASTTSSTDGSSSTMETSPASSTSGAETTGDMLPNSCLTDEECPNGPTPQWYCDFLDGACGQGEAEICRIANDGCGDPPPDLAAPVCGCDGETYPDACNSNASGESPSLDAPCPTPAGFYRCGWRFCRSGLEYCRSETSGAPVPHVYYSCVALPAGCQPEPACDCLSEETCDGSCVATPDGELVMTCP